MVAFTINAFGIGVLLNERKTPGGRDERIDLAVWTLDIASDIVCVGPSKMAVINHRICVQKQHYDALKAELERIDGENERLKQFMRGEQQTVKCPRCGDEASYFTDRENEDGIIRASQKVEKDLNAKLEIAREALEAIGAFEPKDIYDLFPRILAKDALSRMEAK